MQARILAVVGTLLSLIGVGLAAIQEDGFSTLTKIISLVGVGLILVSGILAFGAIVASLRTRQGRFGINVITGSLLFLGILVVVNFLGSRYSARRDLTSNRQFTLAPQTLRVLDRLDEGVTFYVLVPGESAHSRRVNDLVREYESVSDQVSVRWVDAANEPALLERLAIDDPNIWLAVEIGDRVERLSRSELREEPLTNAVLRAITDERKRVCFLMGHGERDVDQGDDTGYSELRHLLVHQNFDVATFSFFDADSVPGDCAILVIAEPRSPLFPEEVEAITRWLDRGKSLLFLAGPVYREGVPVDLGVDSLLSVFGLNLGPGRVFDAAPTSLQRRLGKYSPLGTSFRPHPVSAGMQGQFVIFRNARSVRRDGGRGQAVALVSTGSRTWEEMDPFASTELPTFDQGRDVVGPVPIGVAVWEPVRNWRPDVDVLADPDRRSMRPETRLVVFGDAEFVANRDLRNPAFRVNRNLLLNSVAWLAQDDDLVAVRPKTPEERRFRVSATERNLLRMITLVFYPFAVLGAGIVVWLRRRRRDA